MVMEILYDPARHMVGVLYVVSGLLKVFRLKQFYITFVKYRILKGRSAKLFAYTLPFAEVIAGAWLLINEQVFYAALLALILITSSTAGVAYALYKHNKIDDCGCYGGVLIVPLTWKRLAVNLVWMTLIVFVLIGAV